MCEFIDFNDVEFIYENILIEKEDLSLEELIIWEIKDTINKCNECYWVDTCSYADKMIGCDNLNKNNFEDNKILKE